MSRVLNVPVLHRVPYKTVYHIPRVLSMLGFEYTRVVNVTRLHRVLWKLYFKDSRYLQCFEF